MAMPRFLAVLALLSAALLVRPAQTARMHATSQSVAGPDDMISEHVRKALAAIEIQITLEEKPLLDDRRKLVDARKSLVDFKEDEESWSEWWRLDKHRWVSDDLKNVRKKIKSLENDQIPNLVKAIRDSEDEIAKLSEARDSKDLAAKAAATLEESILHLQAKLSQANSQHIAASMSKEAADTAMEDGKAKVQAHTEMIEKLGEQIKVAKQEIADLKNGSHKLHTKLEEARTAHHLVIAEHSKSIATLSVAIASNQQDEKDAKADQASALGSIAAKLQQISKRQKDLSEQQAAAETNKRKEEEKLAATEAESDASIDKLSKELIQLTRTLEEEKKEQEQNLVAQQISNNAAMTALKMDHKETLTRMSSSIEALEEEKATASKALEKLRQEMANPSQVGSVSDALESAKVDMKIELANFRRDKDVAEENMRRASDNKVLKEAALQKIKDSLFKSYIIHNSLWSSKKKNLQADIEYYRKLSAAYGADAAVEQGKINEVNDALQSNKQASALALMNEGLVETISKQLEEKAMLKSETEEKTAKAVNDLTEEDKEEVATFQRLIAQKVQNIKAANDEYTSITDGTHELHVKWERARSVLKDDIKQHQDTIQSLADMIIVVNDKETETKAARNTLHKDFADTMTTITDQKAHLTASKTAAEASKVSAERDLASTDAEGQAGVDARKMALLRTIEDLKNELDAEQDTLAHQTTTNKEVTQVKKIAAAEALEEAQDYIEHLQLSKETAETRLEGIKKNHVS